MGRPAAIWQTVKILQQPATRNQQIRKVHGLSPTALRQGDWRTPRGRASEQNAPVSIEAKAPRDCTHAVRLRTEQTNERPTNHCSQSRDATVPRDDARYPYETIQTPILLPMRLYTSILVVFYMAGLIRASRGQLHFLFVFSALPSYSCSCYKEKRGSPFNDQMTSCENRVALQCRQEIGHQMER